MKYKVGDYVKITHPEVFEEKPLYKDTIGQIWKIQYNEIAIATKNPLGKKAWSLSDEEKRAISKIYTHCIGYWFKEKEIELFEPNEKKEKFQYELMKML